MPRHLTEMEQQQFLAGKHIAVLSIPSDDERPPLAFPIWYGYRPGGEITYYTHRTNPPSRKLRLLHEGTPVSLCVQREELPYQYVTVEGTVVAVNDAPTAEQMLSIVRRYLPEEAARGYLSGEIESGVALVHFSIRPGRWSGFDFGDDGGD
jgi:nitroimidazol reductase NimA-like FMN-containing flavoprotein (pyridoxamine 5'-phosphate oxidase superfamily)